MFRGLVLFLSLGLPAQWTQVNGQACTNQADLFFVLDGSESVTDENFKATKTFVVEVLRNFNVSRGNVHVGANVFGNSVYDRIKLYGPTRAMYILFEARLGSMSRLRDPGTATYLAIEEMRADFRTEGRNVKKIGVVITDGKSKNVTRTSEQAQLARGEGISMIAVGVGDMNNIFVPELTNIASSPGSVFMTQNISALRQTITDAIKNFMCPVTTTSTTTTATTTTPATTTTTTTTPATTTTTTTPATTGTTSSTATTATTTSPATTTTIKATVTTATVVTTTSIQRQSSPGAGNDLDCPDCMIDNGHGFWRHPQSCEKYIEITADVNGTRKYTTRKCRDGLFWDQYFTTCRLPEQVDCAIDPCKTQPIISYDVENVCGAYILCAGGRSIRACCPINERYVPGRGCVQDPTCADACGNTDETHLMHQTECDKRPYPASGNFYIQSPGAGHLDIVMPCPPGTLFNGATCMCDIMDNAPQTGKLAGCNPNANFTFDVDACDMSGNHAYAGTELVDFLGGEARFQGNGLVNIYRFSMDDFSHGLVLRMVVTPSSQGSNTQALVTNCVYSTEQRSSISIRLERGPSGNVAVFTTDTTLGTQNVSVPYKLDVPNEIVYIYDGSNLTGMVNGVKVKKPLDGNILMRRSGVIIGGGSALDSLTGNVDEFQLYKDCFPTFAEAARSP